MQSIFSPIILVIDSDPKILMSTKSFLDQINYDVFVATDDVAALQISSQLEVDLLICGTRIGFRSGVHLVSSFKASNVCHDVPVIFGSQSQRLGVIRRRHPFGCAYHLQKPYRHSVLLETVEQVLLLPDSSMSVLPAPHFSPQANDKKEIEHRAGVMSSPRPEIKTNPSLFPHVSTGIPSDEMNSAYVDEGFF